MPGAALTVLYAEDDEGDRYFMHRAFNGAGIASALQMVRDGHAAIEYLSGLGPFGDRDCFPVPHLVLLDVNLPQLSGFQVLEWIRQQPAYAELPVVLFSSSSRDEDRARATQLAANDYFEKPTSGMFYTQILAGLRKRWLPSSLTPPSP